MFYLSWNIINSQNILGIAFLSIIFVLFLVVSIVCLIFFISNNIRKYAAKSVDLIDEIRKSPLRNRLQRIFIINEESGQFSTEVQIWRTKFEILMELQLLKKIDQLIVLFKNSKNLKPTIKNLNNFKSLYLEFIEINKNIHTLILETSKVFFMEYVQRDAVTFLKEFFSDLKSESTILSLKEYDINDNKLEKTLNEISKLFLDFYNFLYEGNYEQSSETISKINNALIYLLKFLDSTPYLYIINKKIIPENMSELKNRYVTFGKEGQLELTKNAEKFSLLEYDVDKKRIEVKNMLAAMQFIKAEEKIKNIFLNMEKYKQEAEHENHIKKYFSKSMEDMRETLSLIETADFAIERSYASLPITSNQITDEKKFQIKASSEFSNVKNRANLIFSNIDIDGQKGLLNYKKISEDLLNVFSELEKKAINLQIASNNITDKISLSERYSSEISNLKSILTQCNVKINQFRSIPELNKFKSSVESLENRINSFVNDVLKQTINNPDNSFLEKEIVNLREATYTLSNSFRDTIFIDFISQEMIVYLERYSKTYPEIDNLIYVCEELYKKREFNQLIGVSIDSMNKIKSKNK